MSDRNKSESLSPDALADVAHVNEAHPVSAPDQFTTESSEGMNMTRDWWAYDAEMHRLPDLIA